MTTRKRNPRVLAVTTLRRIKRNASQITSEWSDVHRAFDREAGGLIQVRTADLPEYDSAAWNRMYEFATAIARDASLLAAFAARQRNALEEK